MGVKLSGHINDISLSATLLSPKCVTNLCPKMYPSEHDLSARVYPYTFITAATRSLWSTFSLRDSSPRAYTCTLFRWLGTLCESRRRPWVE